MSYWPNEPIHHWLSARPNKKPVRSRASWITQKAAFGGTEFVSPTPPWIFAEPRPPRPHPRSGPEALVTPIAAQIGGRAITESNGFSALSLTSDDHYFLPTLSCLRSTELPRIEQ